MSYIDGSFFLLLSFLAWQEIAPDDQHSAQHLLCTCWEGSSEASRCFLPTGQSYHQTKRPSSDHSRLIARLRATWPRRLKSTMVRLWRRCHAAALTRRVSVKTREGEAEINHCGGKTTSSAQKWTCHDEKCINIKIFCTTGECSF